ncbi:MAG: glutathione peroxidase [candidate division Zixibacteria bacterium]|nr:glutathione peroxidase [candidate division Zixibacteria bacterium]
MTEVDYRDIPLKTIDDKPTTLSAFNGKVVLIVNVASECGYTKQYAGLEELYREYRDSGLVVVGFPANNFGGQEPGSNEEILSFCQTKFDVTFPMMAKVSVKGKDKHPLFAYLTEQSGHPGEIKWNFSKFLLDRDGNLVSRYDSGVEPMSDELTGAIRKLL